MSEQLSATPGEAQTRPPARLHEKLTPSAQGAGRWARWRREARRTSGWAGLLYIVPALSILLLFEVWPIFYNIWISLWRWDIGPIRFVGLDNYVRLLGEGFVTRDYNEQLVVGEVLHTLLSAYVTPASPAASSSAAEASFGALGDNLLEVEYWRRIGGDAAALLEQFAAEFSEEHAGQISLTSINQGNIQELNQKIRAAAAGGGLPAVTMADDYDVTQYTASGILVALDEYIADGNYGLTTAQIDDILPNQFNRHKLPIYDNKTMAFTQGFSAFTTFWNQDLLTNAGFDARVSSWDEFPD